MLKINSIARGIMLASFMGVSLPGAPLCAEPLRAEPLSAEAPMVYMDEGAGYVSEAGRAVAGRIFGLKDQGGEIRYYAVDLSQRNRMNSAVRSALVPGWGQTFNEDRIKGVSLFIVTGAALTGSVILHNRANDAYDDYLISGRKDGSSFKDYESRRTRSLLLGGVAAAFWIFSVLDAHRHAFTPIYTAEAPVDVLATDDGAQIILRQRF